jgi:hypothetical protein
VWSVKRQIGIPGVDIPDADKGSASGNEASNGKRNFHKRKIEWDGLKK